MTATAPFAGPMGVGTLLIAGALAVNRQPRLAAVTAAAGVASMLASGGRVRLASVPTTPLLMSSDDVRIYAHNILMSNTAGGADLGAQIAAENPDVVVLVEANRTNIADARDGLRQYPYVRGFNLDGDYSQNGKYIDGVLVASKFPFGPLTVVPGAGRPAVETVLRVRDRAVRLIAVHTRAPVNRAWGQEWVGHLDALGRHLEACPDSDVWVVGDFNAERGHAPFRRLLARGRVLDATASAPTWPASGRVPWLLGLDHVLVRGDLAPIRVRLGRPAGSDHLPVIVDLGGPGVQFPR